MSNESDGTQGDYSVDNIVIGSLYLFTPIVIIIFYLPCMYVMATDHELKHLSCLRIMFQMGVTDLIHLCGFMACGLWELTGIVNKIPYWLNRFTITFTIIPGWWNYIALANLLGFNRCLTLISPAKAQTVFSDRMTSFWLGLVWFQTALWMAFFYTPDVAWIYQPPIFCHYFDTSLEWTKYGTVMSFWNCVFHTSLTALWYIIIVLATKFELNGVESNEQLRARERSLLLQSMAICGVLLVADQYWHNLVYLAIPLIGPYAFAVGNMLLICTSGCNPFVYLALNKNIRQKVREMVFKNDQVWAAQAASITIGNTTRNGRSSRCNDQLKVEDVV